MSWFVVYTQPQAETRALQHLERQGFHCFLPRIRRLRRHARKVEPVTAPLFPRYLFVHLELGTRCWRAINGTRGVVGLLSDGSRPLPVPRGVVEDLLRGCDEGAVVPAAALAGLTKHSKIRITSGPFAGQLAEVADIVRRDWVEVLLNILGVPTSLALPSYAIEAA